MRDKETAELADSANAHSAQRLVSLREKAEASLHDWQRTREDCDRVDHRQNCVFQICWLRGYMRALDDMLGKQANAQAQAQPPTATPDRK